MSNSDIAFAVVVEREPYNKLTSRVLVVCDLDSESVACDRAIAVARQYQTEGYEWEYEHIEHYNVDTNRGECGRIELYREVNCQRSCCAGAHDCVVVIYGYNDI